MIWLVLSILSSAALMVVFKFFKKFGISTLHAIVVNYSVAAFFGLLFIQNWNVASYNFQQWLPFALGLGALFICLFFLIGITTQKLGINVATIAMKLGYILPIILAFTMYGEHISHIKLTGIVLTLFALILSSIKSTTQNTYGNKWEMLFPIIIFVGSGVCDAIVQYAEKTFFPNSDTSFFIVTLFLTATIIGFALATTDDYKQKKSNFNKKNIIAGIILGIPNYFSIYFLFKALNAFPNKSALVFPVNNIGIVVVSILIAVLFFSEKLNKLNILGLILAIVSILLMYYENIVQLF